MRLLSLIELLLLSSMAVPVIGETIGSWIVDREHRLIVVHPAKVWDAGDAGLYVSCGKGVPSVRIRIRDPLPLSQNVRLQFGGQSGRGVVFVGKEGVIRTFNGFSRGRNRRDAIANSADSKVIVRELLKNISRFAWDIDTDDGFDSLEVQTTQTRQALQAIGCAK